MKAEVEAVVGDEGNGMADEYVCPPDILSSTFEDVKDREEANCSAIGNELLVPLPFVLALTLLGEIRLPTYASPASVTRAPLVLFEAEDVDVDPPSSLRPPSDEALFTSSGER